MEILVGNLGQVCDLCSGKNKEEKKRKLVLQVRDALSLKKSTFIRIWQLYSHIHVKLDSRQISDVLFKVVWFSLFALL